jgi:anti-sigma factor (TIGR02949 family)
MTMNGDGRPAPFGCRDAVRRLWDYLDHQLEDRDEQALERHLAFCLRCCGELDFARELRGLLRARTDGPLPADVQRRLEGVIDGLGDDEPGR